ncbi:hypothetical protein F4678DRAFT_473944 [Xylaria arbuscula]|nr:hypothetical protein F4678DRAFT_473944 [Xylaria arbuscula]
MSPEASKPAITPYPYNVGQVLTLKRPNGREFSATITQTYPVTLSPAMVVQVHKGNETYEAVLKLHDRRFGDDRKENPYNDDSPEPQTAQAEITWQEFVRQGLLAPLLHRFEYKERMWAEEGKLEWERLGEQEGNYHYKAQKRYKEVRAYDQLRSLQGRCVPRFFTPVTLEMPSAQPDLDPSCFRVPGLLMERLNGFNLSNLVTELPEGPPELWRDIIQKAADIAADVNRAGVLDFDGQPRNIVVVRLEDGTYKPFKIDFGHASIKSDFNDTDDWDEYRCWKRYVYENDNPGAIGCIMTSKVKRLTGIQLDDIIYDSILPDLEGID